MTAVANRALVERFYEELWNRWDLALADQIVAEDIRFRGSLGATLGGREAFKDYVREICAAFPDWQNRIDELIATDDRVVASLTWSGTHHGALRGLAATGKRVSYVGIAIFRITRGRIAEAWVVGDTQELWRQLGVLDR